MAVISVPNPPQQTPLVLSGTGIISPFWFNWLMKLVVIVNTLVTTVNGLTGLTVTITTAKLTTGGTEGSMTFTAGRLTAQTPAT